MTFCLIPAAQPSAAETIESQRPQDSGAAEEEENRLSEGQNQNLWLQKSSQL